jgi:hypothetical protein
VGQTPGLFPIFFEFVFEWVDWSNPPPNDNIEIIEYKCSTTAGCSRVPRILLETALGERKFKECTVQEAHNAVSLSLM